MATDLKTRVEGGCSKTTNEAYEKTYGIVYVRRVAATPEDVYYPMHCGYSSGGIAQLHVNCLLQKFIANRISIADIDLFIREVWMPVGNRRKQWRTGHRGHVFTAGWRGWLRWG